MRSILAAAISLSGCGGCGDEKEMQREALRLWGKDKTAQVVADRAKEAIESDALDERPDLRSRVLNMSFDEVVERIGFARFTASARFLLKRNGHTIDVPENTVLAHGLHGSFSLVQTDKDGAVTREVIYNNGVLYGRNGHKASMRVLGAVEGTEAKIRDEAWQPLRVFTSYYGPRCGLEKVGPSTVKSRGATEYRFVLLDGSPVIVAPNMKGEKKPISLDGRLFVDEATGVPLKASLTGRLEIPPGDPAQNPTPGILELSLQHEVETIEGQEIKPKEFIPTISRRQVDLDPLAFLQGETRTSTVIGGRKKDPPARPPEDLDRAAEAPDAKGPDPKAPEVKPEQPAAPPPPEPPAKKKAKKKKKKR